MRRWIVMLVALFCAPSFADWINLTGAETSPNIAEIYVLDDRVRVVLEVYIGDLEYFTDLVPDDWLTEIEIDRPSLEQRMAHFAQHGITVTADGQRLPAHFDVVEARMRVDRQSPYAGMINPSTRQRVPDAPADKRVVYAEISYPLERRPEKLVFAPPMDDDGNTVATIGFVTYHQSVPVIDFRYLGTATELTLDWLDPWYSKFANPNLKRHHKEALMSFLYVEPYEVRHEVLTRVKDLAKWMDLELRGDEYIEVDELDTLKTRVGEFFLTKNPITIDGKIVTPVLDRTSYVKVGLTGIQIVQTPERTPINTAIVGVILSYLTRGIPQEVTMDWELFTEQMQQVPATATDPAGPLSTFLTPDDNVHTWTNFLKNYQLPTVESVAIAGSLGALTVPLITAGAAVAMIPMLILIVLGRRRVLSITVAVALLAIALVGYPYARTDISRPTFLAGDLPDEQASALLESLLKNVYRAFDFRGEEAVYDRLALSVSGDMLTDIYLQNRRSFAVQQAGGAQAKVKTVEILEADAQRLDDVRLGYAVRGRWTAMGSVGHWGHTHNRKNQYDAVVKIEAVDDSWRITDLEVIEEQRLDQGPPGQSAAAGAASGGETGAASGGE